MFLITRGKQEMDAAGGTSKRGRRPPNKVGSPIMVLFNGYCITELDKISIVLIGVFLTLNFNSHRSSSSNRKCHHASQKKTPAQKYSSLLLDLSCYCQYNIAQTLFTQHVKIYMTYHVICSFRPQLEETKPIDEELMKTLRVSDQSYIMSWDWRQIVLYIGCLLRT